MTPTAAEAAIELESIVAGVTGVRSLYPASSSLSLGAAVASGAAAVGVPVISPGSLIEVREDAEQVSVGIHVALRDTTPAPAAARDILTATRGYFRARGARQPRVTITIGSIG